MRYEDATIGGLKLASWFDAFYYCHEQGSNGLIRVAWPDGKSYLHQENLLIEMFALIRDEYDKVTKVKSNG